VGLGGEGLHSRASSAGGSDEKSAILAAGWETRQIRNLGKKKRSFCGCAESTKGGGWRRQILERRTACFTLTPERIIPEEMVQCKKNLVHCHKPALFQYSESAGLWPFSLAIKDL
jgi:hypothetical protein